MGSDLRPTPLAWGQLVTPATNCQLCRSAACSSPVMYTTSQVLRMRNDHHCISDLHPKSPAIEHYSGEASSSCMGASHSRRYWPASQICQSGHYRCKLRNRPHYKNIAPIESSSQFLADALKFCSLALADTDVHLKCKQTVGGAHCNKRRATGSATVHAVSSSKVHA